MDTAVPAIDGRYQAPLPSTHLSAAYLTPPPAATGRPRLFCFHHAGGGASAFAALRRDLAGTAEVVAVQLPGREGRMRHQLPDTLSEVVAEIDAALDPHLTAADVCYGHSMGGLVAHDVIARRQDRGAVVPARLVIGACRAPRHPVALGHRAQDGRDDLVKMMLEIGGLSREMLGHPEWVDAAVDRIRADLRLCAGRWPAAGPPLACPIHVLHGVDDPLVTHGHLADWAEHTSADFQMHAFDGGHFFFLSGARAAFAGLLASLLERVPNAA
jgi:surfactin synthase thioesterase subunit